MPARFSTVKENAREQALTGDLNRMQALASRDLQNLMAYGGATLDGAPFSSAIQLSQVFGDVGGFTATIPLGSGFFWDPTASGLTADDSGHLVLRWAATPLTFSAPDGTNPRIDLISAVPGAVDTDLQSRNILLDPQTRAMSPANVYKTSNPSTTLHVITGTAAASPVAPAVPAHECAVYEVYVPAGTANASLFYFVPRLWRRASFPASALSGPVTECVLKWDLSVDPATTSSTLALSSTRQHRLLIDGELLTWNGSPTTAAIFQDGGANPLTSAAAATASKPYYVYACGGRRLPQLSLGLYNAVQTAVPIVLVESLTPPDDDGHPTVSISTPRGATRTGAVYVGLGFVFMNTTNRQPCLMTATRTYGKRLIETFSAASSPLTLTSIPSARARDAVEVVVSPASVSAGAQISIGVNPSAMGAPAAIGEGIQHSSFSRASATDTFALFVPMNVPLDDASNGLAFTVTGGTTISGNVKGYGHRVRRVQQ